MNIRMRWEWTQKWIIFEKLNPSFAFAKMIIFASIFHFPFLLFFQTPLWCLIPCSDHHHWQWCPLSSTSTNSTTPSPPATTMPTPMAARAMSSPKWSISDATWAQTMATHCLGSRFFVSSFYKLTNCTFSFIGCILLVTTGADVAQPMPMPTCFYPSSPSKWDVRGLG